ncbi:MAG: type II secretion system protein [Marinobacter nauticus]|uniref:type II secretion system protein n=1 Tax=Marinobacter nauticus TaxID=2743 RepID=UPI001A902F74|nr:type II secretion system protein [Marinobacter nauticus]MBN8241241.1 type II secretion system protein [Marinobacter nauticus]
MEAGLVLIKNHKSTKGFSLIEMLVSLTILGILASVAIPFAEVAVVRKKEYELRENLRTVREALDEFYADWQGEIISRNDEGSSRNGYPVSLSILVEGVPLKNSQDIRKYLRRIPRDPFNEDITNAEEHWALRSSQDEPDSTLWGGEDVFDIRSKSDRVALDGSNYRNW